MVALNFVVAVVAVPIALITAFFAVEVFLGLRRLRSLTASSIQGKAVIVIPAHDEELVIAETVSSLASQQPAEVVLVVAHNCSDSTAQKAAAAGAEVLVRQDKGRRGKGFALSAARDHLRNDPPAVVIVMDADCRLDRRSIDALVDAAITTARPCQAVNLLSPDLSAPPMVQISNFAFMIKNLTRQRGLQRLAGRAHLTGTGMALPWSVFETANLGGANIVEDLALGLDLASRAKPPLLVEDATVWSPSASSGGTLVQRRRWEGGYLATAARTAPLTFLRGIRGRDIQTIYAALDLSVPPLALLAALNVAACVIAGGGIFLGAQSWPLLLQVIAGALAGSALAAAWAREGRRFASAATLVRLPLYVLWKLPLYAGLIRRGAPREWLRTGR